MRQICRRLLVAVLSVSLCLSTLPPTRVLARGWAATVGAEQGRALAPADADLGAWAAGGVPGVRVASVDADDVDADEDGDAGEPYLGEGAVTLSGSAVTIDGVEISRAQFCAAALPGMARLQDTPETGAMSEYARLLSLSAAAEGAVLELGQAIEMTFIRLLMRTNIATILAFGGAGAFLICAGSIPGVDRDIIVVVTTLGTMAVDGVIIGASWLGLEISSYIAENYAAIKVVADAIHGTLTDEQRQVVEGARDKLMVRLRLLINAGELNETEWKDCTVVVAGYNKRTCKYAIGVKLQEGNEGAEAILKLLSGTKEISDTPVSIETLTGPNVCAEDACTKALGGSDGAGHVIKSELKYIVMAQPFRPRGERVPPPLKWMPKPVPVCKRCEGRFGRGCFLPRTWFDSGPSEE